MDLQAGIGCLEDQERETRSKKYREGTLRGKGLEWEEEEASEETFQKGRKPHGKGRTEAEMGQGPH